MWYLEFVICNILGVRYLELKSPFLLMMMVVLEMSRMDKHHCSCVDFDLSDKQRDSSFNLVYLSFLYQQ